MFFKVILSVISASVCLITELQRQLEKKQQELNFTTANIERLIANPRISKLLDLSLCDNLSLFLRETHLAFVLFWYK